MPVGRASSSAPRIMTCRACRRSDCRNKANFLDLDDQARLVELALRRSFSRISCAIWRASAAAGSGRASLLRCQCSQVGGLALASPRAQARRVTPSRRNSARSRRAGCNGRPRRGSAACRRWRTAGVGHAARPRCRHRAAWSAPPDPLVSSVALRAPCETSGSAEVFRMCIDALVEWWSSCLPRCSLNGQGR